MGKRRIARAGLLIAFTISLCELSRACGGFLGTEIKVVKAADTKDVVSEITNEKIAKITNYKTTSYTKKSLTSKKTYYYKVRAYKTINGKKVYGKYSSIKSKKAK